MKPNYQKIMVPALLLLVLIPVFSGLIRARQKTDDSVPADRGVWSICEQQQTRDRDFYQCDTTSDRLYVSYSGYDCVDVYDHCGTFLYTLQFPKRQNGVVSVRCEGEQTYISDKDSVVYIFEDRVLLRKLSREEAEEAGCGADWFHSKQPQVEVQRDKIRWLDEQGNVVKQTVTPTVLRQTIPPDEELKAISLWVFLGAWVMITAYAVIAHIQKRRRGN